MSIIRQNKTFLSILTCLFLVFCAFFITRQYTVKAEDGMPDGKFSTMSQAATDYFNQYKAGYYGTDSTGIPLPECMGTAGGVLGYTNSENVGTTIGVYSQNTESSGSYNYEALQKIYKQYGYYGYALTQMGFDSTEMNGLPSSMRQFVGILISALFMMAQGISLFWDFVLLVLEKLNPFYLLKSAISGVTDNAVGLGTDPAGVSGALTEGMTKLAERIGDFYSMLQDFATYTTLPLLIVCTLFIWLVIKQGQGAAATFKKLLIRIAFAFIGVPLMFSCYTSALSLVKGFTADNISMGNVIIASNLIDFESWVYRSRLAFSPTGNMQVVVDSKTGLLDTDTSSKLRMYTYLINTDAFTNGAGDLSKSPVSNVSAINSAGLVNDPTTGIVNYDQTIINHLLKKESGGDTLTSSANATRNALNLLERYAKGDKISASSFASWYYTNYCIPSSKNYGEHACTGDGFIALSGMSSDWQAFHPDTVTDLNINLAGETSIKVKIDKAKAFDEARFTQPTYPFGGANSYGSKVNARNPFGDSTMTAEGEDGTFTYKYVSGGDNSAGLSGMAMYNYLSSTFDANKINVYAAKVVSGDGAKAEHYSVNFVGKGLVQVIYILDAICLLSAFSVIGYGYGLSIMLSNIKAMFKIVPSVLSGVIGSMRGIASSLILVAAMIIEVLGTCVLYCLACEFVSVIYSMIEVPIAHIISTALGESLGGGDMGTLCFVAIGISTIAVLIILVKKMLQWRYAICQSITETTTSVINGFLGTSVGAPELGRPAGSFGQAVGNAALLAGGMAVAAGSDGRSLGEALGLSSSETAETGDRDDDSNSSGKSYSNTDNTKGLGVKSDNGTGETPGGSGTSSDSYNGSDINSANINSEREAEAYAEANKDVIENMDNGSGGTVSSAATEKTSSDVTSETTSETDLSETKDNTSATHQDRSSTSNSDETESETTTKNKSLTSETNVDESTSENNVSSLTGDKAGSGTAYTVQGDDGQQYTMINPKTGQPYTAQDAANGESYALVNGNGEHYVDANGMEYGNVSAHTLVGSKDGQISSINTPSGSLSTQTSTLTASNTQNNTAGTVSAGLSGVSQNGSQSQGSSSSSHSGAQYSGSNLVYTSPSSNPSGSNSQNNSSITYAVGAGAVTSAYMAATMQNGGYGVPQGGASGVSGQSSSYNTYNTYGGNGGSVAPSREASQNINVSTTPTSQAATVPTSGQSAPVQINNQFGMMNTQTTGTPTAAGSTPVVQVSGGNSQSVITGGNTQTVVAPGVAPSVAPSSPTNVQNVLNGAANTAAGAAAGAATVHVSNTTTAAEYIANNNTSSSSITSDISLKADSNKNKGSDSKDDNNASEGGLNGFVETVGANLANVLSAGAKAAAVAAKEKRNKK